MSAHEIRRQLVDSAPVKQSFSDEFISPSTGSLPSARTVKSFSSADGGCAADAIHLAAEARRSPAHRRARPSRPRAFHQPSVLTAANDYGFEHIFARPIEFLVSPNDILVALSNSAKSPNIVRGLELGRARQAYILPSTGQTGGDLTSKVDLLRNVASDDPQHIQETHITVGNIACSVIPLILSGLE